MNNKLNVIISSPLEGGLSFIRSMAARNAYDGRFTIVITNGYKYSELDYYEQVIRFDEHIRPDVWYLELDDSKFTSIGRKIEDYIRSHLGGAYRYNCNFPLGRKNHPTMLLVSRSDIGTGRKFCKVIAKLAEIYGDNADIYFDYNPFHHSKISVKDLRKIIDTYGTRMTLYKQANRSMHALYDETEILNYTKVYDNVSFVKVNDNRSHVTERTFKYNSDDDSLHFIGLKKHPIKRKACHVLPKGSIIDL